MKSVYEEVVKCPFFKRINLKNKTIICERILEDSLSVSTNFASKKQIEEQLCFGKRFKRVQSIQLGGSDSHNQGQQVIQCLLDNGCRMIYKPHSMNKEMD